MQVSFNWLKEYIDLDDVTPYELGDRFTLSGLEVENIYGYDGGIDNLVVGEVLTAEPIEDSDYLYFTTVDIGQNEPQSIVCGAPNVEVGQKVIVALPGAVLPGDFEIKETSMMGYPSNGMICSLQELGFEESVIAKEYAEGIYVLPEESTPGEDVNPLLGLDDYIYEFDITPNRADALSMRGVAHEVSAILDKPLRFAEKDLEEDAETSITEKIEVSVENPDDTPIYEMRVIENVEVRESPIWLQRKLMAAGMRPIDNLVDITNYIMLEYGQPLHAFDYDAIGTSKIHVRRANEDEELVTLDGKERLLSEENLVITDGENAIGLAGVMGGENSHISDTTTRVALEAAVFNPIMIRRTAGQLDLRSEASSRYEKGLNIAVVTKALDHAATLMAELGGGKVVQGVASERDLEPEITHVPVSLDYLNKLLGLELTEPVLFDILERLGFGFEVQEEENNFVVHVPPRRWDISIPADIAEEVARVYGYNRVPATLPEGKWLPVELTPDQKATRLTNAYLESVGLNQAITYSLTTTEKANIFTAHESEDTTLSSPMSEDHKTLRKSLVPGLLDAAQYNRARSMKDVFLYETGSIYLKADNQKLLDEKNHVAGLLLGSLEADNWMEESRPVDFFTVKGIVEDLINNFGLVSKVTYEAVTDRVRMHPGRTAKVLLDGLDIGYLGQVHPTTAAEFDLEDTYVFELNLEMLVGADKVEIHQEEIPKYPGITRDVALLVDKTVSHQEIVNLIREESDQWLSSITLFDYYQGENIPENKKSVAYSLYYQNPNKTLKEDEVNEDFEHVQNILSDKLNADIR